MSTKHADKQAASSGNLAVDTRPLTKSGKRGTTTSTSERDSASSGDDRLTDDDGDSELDDKVTDKTSPKYKAAAAALAKKDAESLAAAKNVEALKAKYEAAQKKSDAASKAASKAAQVLKTAASQDLDDSQDEDEIDQFHAAKRTTGKKNRARAANPRKEETKDREDDDDDDDQRIPADGPGGTTTSTTRKKGMKPQLPTAQEFAGYNEKAAAMNATMKKKLTTSSSAEDVEDEDSELAKAVMLAEIWEKTETLNKALNDFYQTVLEVEIDRETKISIFQSIAINVAVGNRLLVPCDAKVVHAKAEALVQQMVKRDDGAATPIMNAVGQEMTFIPADEVRTVTIQAKFEEGKCVPGNLKVGKATDDEKKASAASTDYAVTNGYLTPNTTVFSVQGHREIVNEGLPREIKNLAADAYKAAQANADTKTATKGACAETLTRMAEAINTKRCGGSIVNWIIKDVSKKAGNGAINFDLSSPIADKIKKIAEEAYDATQQGANTKNLKNEDKANHKAGIIDIVCQVVNVAVIRAIGKFSVTVCSEQKCRAIVRKFETAKEGSKLLRHYGERQREAVAARYPQYIPGGVRRL